LSFYQTVEGEWYLDLCLEWQFIAIGVI
jgi:hypothetical protein